MLPNMKKVVCVTALNRSVTDCYRQLTDRNQHVTSLPLATNMTTIIATITLATYALLESLDCVLREA